MGKLHQILPFTEFGFFYFVAIGIALLAFGKLILSKTLKYSYLMAFVSLAYILLYFTKPVQIIGLMTYFYLI